MKEGSVGICRSSLGLDFLDQGPSVLILWPKVFVVLRSALHIQHSVERRNTVLHGLAVQFAIRRRKEGQDGSTVTPWDQKECPKERTNCLVSNS
jgi:hypothetical protein